MSKDYEVTMKSGLQYIANTLAEAKKIALDYAEFEPIIDEHDGEELTGTYWTLEISNKGIDSTPIFEKH